MNTDDLRVLAERADSVQGRVTTRLGEVQHRIVRARRRRAAGAIAAAATAVLAVVLASTLPGGNEARPVEPANPSPSPSETFRVPPGQTTVKADVHPADIRGWKVMATLTNTQPEHRGATELATTVTPHTDATTYSIYCHSADPAVWLFFAFTDGGGGYGRCDEGSPSLQPPDISPRALVGDVGTRTTFRMFVARLSPQEEKCYLKSDGCSERYGPPHPLATTHAEFGFRLFDLPQAPVVLELFKEPNVEEAPYWFKALSSINGIAWLVDRAVVAAPDAHRLAFELPASKGGYLVDVYTAHGPHFDRCVTQHADEIPDWESTDSAVYAAAVDKVCGVDLRLVVDGTTVTPERGVDPALNGHFSDLGAQLSAGAHQVEVEVVAGDPRNIRFAVVVHVRTQMP